MVQMQLVCRTLSRKEIFRGCWISTELGEALRDERWWKDFAEEWWGLDSCVGPCNEQQYLICALLSPANESKVLYIVIWSSAHAAHDLCNHADMSSSMCSWTIEHMGLYILSAVIDIVLTHVQTDFSVRGSGGSCQYSMTSAGRQCRNGRLLLPNQETIWPFSGFLLHGGKLKSSIAHIPPLFWQDAGQ